MQSADIIIYGGTSAAIIAAVQAKRMNASVIIICPETRIGGLSSGGLGYTDSGKTDAIGGLAREFYERLYDYYSRDEHWQWEKQSDYDNKGQGTPALDHDAKAAWCFEPKAALHVFESFVKDYDIPVYKDEWLDRDGGVELAHGKIKTIRTLSGNSYQGKVFLDCSYEGDLMAAAGVSFHVGREANSVYDEEWNGIQVGTLHHNHYFFKDVSPYKEPGNPESGILPHISTEDPGNYGEGDNKVQAYCFRVCMSNHPENSIPFPKPENYDPDEYELFLRSWNDRDDFFVKFDRIPNRKTDTNNCGAFSTDYIGANWDYPEAGYKRRAEIIADHKRYQLGYHYFAQNDPRVRKDIHDELQNWGLPKDEYVETGNWSPQLYIREARRMVGKAVMTEHDVLSKRPVQNSVGMGSYTLDSHNIQRYITPEGFVQNEGDIGVHTKGPYSINYHCLVPKDDEVKNILVPVCMSSSHIAFGSIRMEPVFMLLAQSAATGAVLALQNETAVQDIDYDELREQLIKDKQILEL